HVATRSRGSRGEGGTHSQCPPGWAGSVQLGPASPEEHPQITRTNAMERVPERFMSTDISVGAAPLVAQRITTAPRRGALELRRALYPGPVPDRRAQRRAATTAGHRRRHPTGERRGVDERPHEPSVAPRHVLHHREGDPVPGGVQQVALEVELRLIGHHAHVVHFTPRGPLVQAQVAVTLLELAGCPFWIGRGGNGVKKGPRISKMLAHALTSFVARV